MASSYQMHAGTLTGYYGEAVNGDRARPTSWAVVTGATTEGGAPVNLFVADASAKHGGIWRFSYTGQSFASDDAPWCAPPGGVGALTSVGEGLVWVDAAGTRVWKTAAGGEACAPRELRALSLNGTNSTYTSVSFLLPSGAAWVDGKVDGGAATAEEAGGGDGFDGVNSEL